MSEQSPGERARQKRKRYLAEWNKKNKDKVLSYRVKRKLLHGNEDLNYWRLYYREHKHKWKEWVIIPLTNARAKPKFAGVPGVTGQKAEECRYFGRFFAFFLTFATWGVGGVVSILRSTSSALGCGVGLRSCFMVGV